MKRNLTRIKINNQNIFKISCSGEKDYIFSYPKAVIKNAYSESHFTFHTKNNRITFKITNVGDNKKDFNDIKSEAIKKGLSVSTKDIDLYNQRYISEENLKKDLNYLFSFAYRDKKDNFLNNAFLNSTTKDDLFSKLIQINIPNEHNFMKLNFYISKNLIQNPINIIRLKKLRFNEIFMIHDCLHNNDFIFVLLMSSRKIINWKGIL